MSLKRRKEGIKKMKCLKKNQVIIYVIVLMLMTAGYLNYTTNTKEQETKETAMQIEDANNEEMQIADIGDATLVNSNEIITQNTANTTNTINATDTANTSNTNNLSNTENITSNTTSKNEIKSETIQTSNTSNNNNEYFVKSKLERDTMYSQMLETYEKVLSSSNSLETQKQSATQEIQKINDTKNSIMICENLIKTKGFENSIIFVNGESVSIIIGAKELKQEEVAQIQNIISREMKVEVKNIHIGTKVI